MIMLHHCILWVLLGVLATCRIQQVVSLFRHGARYSSSYYQLDPGQNDYFAEELTAVGMRQHFNFGRMLRRDYIQAQGFLSDDYKPGQIVVYATDYNRTLMSAQSQLLGLYPLGRGRQMPVVDQELHLPPYSNRSDSSQQRYSLPEGYLPFGETVDSSVLYRECPRYDRTTQQNINYFAVAYKQMNLTYYPLMIKLSTVFGIPLQQMNFTKVVSLYDTLTVNKYLGQSLPDQITQDDYYNMQHIYRWLTHIRHSRGLVRAINDQKFRSILKDFGGRVDQPNREGLKWRFLSAHDTDINPFLFGLNISSADCVEQLYRRGYTDALNCEPNSEFASSLIVELHSNARGEYQVKVRHNGRYVYLCERRQVACGWEEFKRRILDQMVTDEQYYAACGRPEFQQGAGRDE